MPDEPDLELDERDTAALNGELGAGIALAMRVLVGVARSMRASRLIDISQAHVDGCLYIGQVSLDFAERLAGGGARVRVPTTTNVSAIDRLRPDTWRGDPEMVPNARRLMDAYTALGCAPTWTCAPYQLTRRPSLGENIAWGESNAIVFANSVLGARTERYGDFVDLSAAIVGRAPFAGLHTDEGRHGQVLIEVEDVPAAWRASDAFYPLVGLVIGQIAGSQVPVLTGIASATEDQLKALGAAAASTGSVALFHVVGVTPEAPTVEACFPVTPPTHVARIGQVELREAWARLNSGKGDRLGAVCIGTPHFSESEFDTLAELLDGRQVHPTTPLVVSTSRHVWSRVIASGLADHLMDAGIQVVTDTCTYSTPILGRIDGLVLTNSAKYAWYAPANIGAEIAFASLPTCVESAVAGRLTEDPLG